MTRVMTPQEKYHQALTTGLLCADTAQATAVDQLEALYQRLNGAQATQASLWSRFFCRRPAQTGLYLWGGTGRGKTHLMDSFYSCIDFDDKHRLHFHRFMRDIHAQIREHPHMEDPLSVIGREWAERYRLLCLDEFHVTDITDAMILARLLDALFSNGVTLVTTSNIAIDDLYRDGLQRSSFLPAIDLLHRYTLAVALGEGADYRLSYLEQAQTYYIIDNAGDCLALHKHFHHLADVEPKHARTIEINRRAINYVAWANDIIWFDFAELCGGARSAMDYLEIAQCFDTVFISNVTHMNDEQNDVARRFLHLIDALYDHRVKVFISAEAPAQALYTGANMAFAFERAVSRLAEMASKHYLAEAHH
ncbi:MAG: cell division protein ZapE [Gammaproteobacteria bacterium]